MDYIKINQRSWDMRTEVHYDSAFYDNEAFINGKNSLNDIELNIIGDVKGKSILHLQCHFGQDTIQWTRLGASATGVDFSRNAIKRAKDLAEITNSPATFIQSDIYDLPNHHDQQYDIVFTSYGTIGWLPDINKWAAVINHFLKPGGQFLIVDFHPVVWMYDDNFEKLTYKYFNDDPIVEEEGTYTEGDEHLKVKCISWNHGLGEIINSLIHQDLKIKSLDEFDYSPYDCFQGTEKIADRKYRITKMGDKIPMVYAILAEK